jgi:GNAT superfamily N-acetyltransferase
VSEPEIRELPKGESGLAFDAMRELRPMFADPRELAIRIDQVQRREGYRLVGAFLPGEERAVAVAGFRIVHLLAWGRALYVDDLSTLPDARRRGLGGLLMGWLLEEARRQHCDQLHLDSGVGPERADAHRLYMNSGLRITSHHFAITVAPKKGTDGAPNHW